MRGPEGRPICRFPLERPSRRPGRIPKSPLFAPLAELLEFPDDYGTRIIAGRGGLLITDHDDRRLSVLLMGTGAGWWNNRRRTLLAAGCRLEQDGDTEGSLGFDPANVTACALAVKAAGCKRRKVPTDAQRTALATGAFLFRGDSTWIRGQKTPLKSPIAAQGGPSPLPDASDAA